MTIAPTPAADSVTFRPSRPKAILFLSGCLCFLAIGIWMVPSEPWMGWLCVGFSGIGVAVFALQLLSNKVYLRIDAQGYEMQALFRKGRTNWRDIAHVGVGVMNHGKVIGITYTDAYRSRSFRRGLGITLAGMDAVIPNTYTVPTEEIVAAMNAWRARAADAAS